MGDLLIEVWLYYQLVNIMLHSNISKLKVILFNGPNILLSTTQISSVTQFIFDFEGMFHFYSIQDWCFYNKNLASQQA